MPTTYTTSPVALASQHLTLLMNVEGLARVLAQELFGGGGWGGGG